MCSEEGEGEGLLRSKRILKFFFMAELFCLHVIKYSSKVVAELLPARVGKFSGSGCCKTEF